MKNEIVLFQSGELAEHIEVRLDEEKETFWMTLKQISNLFERDNSVISRHFKNIFKENELDKNSVVAFFATTANDGKTYQVEHFNLDAILSVGYRVNSKRGTQFRIWANSILKQHLMKGYSINNRVNRIEDKIEKMDHLLGEIIIQLKTQELPNQGIFFDGQIFDAYVFFSEIIKKAKEEIILIDNYIDETTLTHLSKKNKKVKVILYSKNLSKQLDLDIKKANEQYGGFEIQSFAKSHDRFLIIDKNTVYHIGASLKDLGKKWFAFTKMDKVSIENILNAIFN
jgi:hypothetical protein